MQSSAIKTTARTFLLAPFHVLTSPYIQHSTLTRSFSKSASCARTSKTSVPVLIAGAGPVGLFQAYLLTKLGIPVRVIDREMTLSPLSKALSIQSRSLEIFEMTGIIKKFVARGQFLTGVNFYVGPKHAVTVPITAGVDTHYPHGLFLEQAKTSEILAEELKKLGVSIDHGWELLDTKVVEEEGKGMGKKKTYVETTIRKALSGDNRTADESKLIGEVNMYEEQADKEYEIQVVRSEYLVAADGGRSTVRHKLNIAFPGRTLAHKTLMWDGKCETDIVFNCMTLVHGPDNKNLSGFALTNGDIRLILEDGDIKPGEDIAKTLKDLTVERFEELAGNIVAPGKFKITETSWLTLFKINERRAEHFVYKNRIFLAGDAAHVHSPAGGQGMNTGLQDAHNLAWKLAFVINGIAPESLLETYEEREAMADRAIALSSKLLTANRARGAGFKSGIRRQLFAMLAPIIIPVTRFFAAAPQVPMLNVCYHGSTLNQVHATQPAPAAECQVGVRARDGSLRAMLPAGSDTNAEVKQRRLHELMLGIGRFYVLVFTSDMLTYKNSTSGRVIQDIATTNAKELEHNLDSFVSQWRSKWSYAANLYDGHQDKDLFKVHVISGGYLQADKENNSLEVLINKKEGDGKVFLDDTKAVHQKYGFEWNKGAGGIVVVRPDSHIGYRVNGAGEQAWSDVQGYLNSILSA